MDNAEQPVVTPEHIRELWDAGLTGSSHQGQPALCLTADSRVVVSDRVKSGTLVITAAELRNFTRGRFTAQDARQVAWALTEELRHGAAVG
ncbi:hypothetical protein E1262_27165 [Jiangella aurantiaca]|uniref:Uncharacterized protein n=1 Tax=Jiangella aurantiaca TaxID=2530373 RepID=A0A4R5A5E6_9ACTN|nr:hypothetical protein [Jiangella aurantiaca]TDD64772.1 hypothetical protein E1262_27165 [Jiangella aurantiaca]